MATPTPPTMPDGSPWPRISIVTPSFNQGPFLERTIRSVLGQGYPNLEYIIIDGGSTDDSVAIIEQYAPQLAYWVSERDKGMYDAINKGFARATGEVMAWLNSDDMHMPWALHVVGEIMAQHRGRVRWLMGLPGSWNGADQLVSVSAGARYVQGLIARGLYHGRGLGWVQQESTFWSRELWEQAGGGLRADLRLAGDFELWQRFARYAPLYVVQTVLSGFRRHPDQQTARRMGDYYAEVERVMRGQPGALLRRMVQLPVIRQATRLGLRALGPRHMIAYSHKDERWVLIER